MIVNNKIYKLLGILFLSIFITNCNEDIKIIENSSFSKNYIENFKKSKSYNNLKLTSRFKAKIFFIDEYSITFIKNEKNINVPMIYAYIKDNEERLIGKIEAVSYKDKDGRIVDYNTLLTSIENFNLKQETGSITLIDITEDFKFVKAIVEEGLIKKRISFSHQTETFNKFKRNHPMDINGDGNVSWSECYKYANDACMSDPECFSMCYFWGDGVGWVMTNAGPLCQGAIATACVVTSWKY